jgi:cytochrome c-type biogenesis protein CcmH/NrfG
MTMSDATSDQENSSPAIGDRPRRIVLAPLWLASVLVLSLGIAGLGAYLMMRQPEVVERILPPPPLPNGVAEAQRRAEALRARNLDLANRIEAVRRELDLPPQCPPGTELDPADGSGKPAPGTPPA